LLIPSSVSIGQKIFFELAHAKMKLGRQRKIVLLTGKAVIFSVTLSKEGLSWKGAEEILRHIKTSRQVVSAIVIGITFIMGFILIAPSYASYFTGVSIALNFACPIYC
jgi:hypothetical protein